MEIVATWFSLFRQGLGHATIEGVTTENFPCRDRELSRLKVSRLQHMFFLCHALWRQKELLVRRFHVATEHGGNRRFSVATEVVLTRGFFGCNLGF